MERTSAVYKTYVEILKRELVCAMGCTEPIAIAYCAAVARKALGTLPSEIDVAASGNIIKNVKSVIVPNTGGLRGIEAAAAIGALAGDAEAGLQVVSHVTPDEIAALPKRVEALGSRGEVAARIGVGEPTLRDMVAELVKPGRDPRDELPKPLLRTDVMELSDLKPGMVLTGTVRNVTDFGAFVDIAVHEDGLVHISQICNRYIRHPSEVLKVGDIVRVKVLDVDLKRKRISLTMKDLEGGEKR